MIKQVQVPVRQTVTKYETSDGVRFDRMDAAIQHEAQLEVRRFLRNKLGVSSDHSTVTIAEVAHVLVMENDSPTVHLTVTQGA